MEKYDVLIVGGGMVGLTTALAIRKNSPLTVAIVDTQPLKEITSEADVRVSAINAVSQQLFNNLGIWSDVEHTRCQPYQHMHIWDKAGYGQIDFDLAKRIVSLNHLTYASLGMWNKKKLPFPSKKNVKHLWCKSLYPTFNKDLKNFPKKFTSNFYAGYSDHTIGIETCLLAISRGAKIIEKHFTLDKSSSVIRDHALSATPEEFTQLVNLGREIEKKISLSI